MASDKGAKGHHGSHGEKPANQPHGSTAEETARLNETFRAFSEGYYKDDEERRSRERKKFRIERWLALGVALNVALTLGLLYAGVSQAIYSGQQVRASQDQLEIMRESEHKQLKAYVGVTQHGIQNFGTPNHVLKITRKNYGQTPAIDLYVAPPNVAVVQTDRPVQFNPMFCVPAPNIVNSFTLFPQQEANFEMRGVANISPEQIDSIRKGTSLAVMYWGAIFYKDVFGSLHCSRYCWTFKGPEMTETTADSCAQHNDFHDVTEELDQQRRAAEKAPAK